MKKTVKLNDILSITRGASPRPISNYITNESDGVNWIKIGDVDPNSFFITHTEEKITKEGAKKSRYVKEGDFILSNSMSFGRPYILKINGCVHDGWLILSDYENYVTSSYLYYLLRSPIVQNQFDGSANGATVRNLNSDIVRKVSVSIHTDKTEQQKIASHLDTIQSAIDNKKQQLAQLDELVKSKFVEMFGETPVESGKWKVEKLDTLVQVTSSKRIYAEEQTDSGIPFLRISDLVSRINGLEQAELYISYEKYNEFGKKGWVPTKDDILVTTRGTLGLCYIIREDDEFYFQDGMITWLKFDNHEKVLSVFICYLFAYVLSPKFNIKSNGATVKYLSISDLKVEKIPVPPIELQNDFAAYVQKIDSAKSIIKTQLNDLNELLESKMDFYFGE